MGITQDVKQTCPSAGEFDSDLDHSGDSGVGESSRETAYEGANHLDTPKIAVILQAGTESHEGLARALHALLYTKELTEEGITAKLIFDGAGSEWAAKLIAPESPQEKGLAELFEGLNAAGVAYEICDYCSGAFHVKDKLQAANVPLTSQYMNHPSVATLVKDGYQVWIL